MAMLVTTLAAGCSYGASFADCEVTCHAPDQCPDGFSCGTEGLCRAGGATQSCMAVLADAHMSGDGGGNTQVTLRQTVDDSIAPNLTDACANADGTTADMHWYRVFSLAQAGIATTFHVTGVTFGVEKAVGTPQARVALGTYSGTFGQTTLDTTKITPLSSSQITVADASTGGLVTQAFNHDVPGNANLVVEIDVADQNGTGRVMNLGLTTSAEARPGYDQSSKCGPAVPTEPANKHLVITVTGTH
jgi:hypothetical protein